MVDTFDNFLIDRVFEPIAHKLQKLTGVTNFKLTLFFYRISVALLILFLVFFSESLVVNSILIPLLIVAYFLGIKEIETDEKNHKLGMVSRARYYKRFSRLFSIFYLIGYVSAGLIMGISGHSFSEIYDLERIIMLYVWISIALTHYFYACTPLPPAQSILRKMWNSVLTELNDWLVGTPQPQHS